MKGMAISIRQPWASLIVSGLKTIEIRSWSTNYRGCLLIHASKTLDQEAIKRFPLSNPVTGALIGVVELSQVKPATPTEWEALAVEHLNIGPFSPHLHAWYVTNPIAFDVPVPCKGERRLFPVTFEDSLLPLQISMLQNPGEQEMTVAQSTKTVG